MITSLRLVNFKNFADETLRVGPFTVIVGTNASGKSNIRDAFRFLHGIGRGDTLSGIFGGKYGPRIQKWEPIRGAPNEIVRFGAAPSGFSLYVELESSGEKAFYSITVKFEPDNPVGFYVLQEELRIGSRLVYTAKTQDSTLRLVAGEGENQKEILFSPYKPALPDFYQRYEYQYLPEAEASFHYMLNRMCFMELVPERMRAPSFPGATELGDSGENLPTALEAICVDPERKKILADWLQELTPMDVRDFEFPHDPSGRVHLQIVEANGRKVSAYSASDGTLRFLAMLTMLLGPHSGGLYFFEEIDTGIHPARQSLLLELVEKQTAKGHIQVITTTHSPDLLNLVNDRTFENTSIVYRDEDSEDGIIRPLAELPNARELRKSQGLGRLLGGGWMETALAFTGGNHDDEENEE